MSQLQPLVRSAQAGNVSEPSVSQHKENAFPNCRHDDPRDRGGLFRRAAPNGAKQWTLADALAAISILRRSDLHQRCASLFPESILSQAKRHRRDVWQLLLQRS